MRAKRTVYTTDPTTVRARPFTEGREGAARARVPVGITRILRAGSRQGHSWGRIGTTARHTSGLGPCCYVLRRESARAETRGSEHGNGRCTRGGRFVHIEDRVTWPTTV